MNRKAFSRVNYGVFLLCAEGAAKAEGRIITSFQQITPDPPRKILVTLHSSGATYQAVLDRGCFSVTVLADGVPRELLERFGHRSGLEEDKFAGYEVQRDGSGAPWVADSALARFACRVLDRLETGDRTVFVAEVTEAEILADGVPFTLDGYKNGGGSTPDTATAARSMVESWGWRCRNCGFLSERTELPEEYHCPICGGGRDRFRRRQEV